MGGIVIFAVFILPITKHGISLYLFMVSLISFIAVYSFLYTDVFTFLGRFIPMYFILFVTVVNGLILQVKLQQYLNWEHPNVQTGFRRGGETTDKIANIFWIIGKAREFQRKSYFCFIDYAKAFECVNHNNPWKIIKEMGIPDYLTCLLRNLYKGKEAIVRTRYGTKNGSQIAKGVHQDYMSSPCLFNFYAEYIMWNASLDES